ncbi:NAD(+) diphosphatase [Agromyces ramosus]|uniref:NAD(+) diphosphatase n=1 Tax=Agromyces ramosus TaxID=33879 RepID=A0ABU0R410_9MICO|nr:NAD(+) diphosphatase [Agromyces ramosus]MDQ0892810.1 NAD+ diphosphatase [Agromyces ramosus]
MSEPTFPPLTRPAIDRDAKARSDAGFEAAFDADPAARVVALHRGTALLEERVDGSAPRLELRHPSELPAPLLRCYLGRDTEARYELWLFDEAAAHGIEPEAARWEGLRHAAAALDGRDAALFTAALAIANWHEGHGHCPRCGATTEPTQAGWARRCTREGNLLFPRTDPAVIVLVTDDRDRVLLGSNALWEQHRFSLLAGFVEPGESLEAAVVRELGEETGLPVDHVEYVGSQPWPFPASLMLGFTARLESGIEAATATPDGEEILELRWFTRDELVGALADITLPGETSIARWLLERWFGGPIGAPEHQVLPWTTS